jgi:hypothetical protein
MLCETITLSHFLHVTQDTKPLEVSLRQRENVTEPIREFESLPCPVACHVCS